MDLGILIVIDGAKLSHQNFLQIVLKIPAENMDTPTLLLHLIHRAIFHILVGHQYKKMRTLMMHLLSKRNKGVNLAYKDVNGVKRIWGW